MFTAIAIMVCGIVLGRMFRAHISATLVRKGTLLAILLLLFLLGVSIGGNDKLLAALPTLGLQALVLMGFCVAGSIAAIKLIAPFCQRSAGRKDGGDTDIHG